MLNITEAIQCKFTSDVIVCLLLAEAEYIVRTLRGHGKDTYIGLTTNLSFKYKHVTICLILNIIQTKLQVIIFNHFNLNTS